MIELTEVVHYFNLGFKPLYLHEKDKRPLSLGWTKRPLKLSEIESNFNTKHNLGTLLGQKIDGYYLTGIDVDFKEKNNRAKKEVAETLIKLIPGREFAAAPCALSGRRNGSCHFYLLLKEQPINKTFKSEFSDWEISVCTTGRQFVLPPSTHPITGREYVWKKKPRTKKDFPKIDRIEFGAIEGKTNEIVLRNVDADFQSLKLSTINIDSYSKEKLPLSIRLKIHCPEQDNYYLIDRSAFLFKVINEMVPYLDDSEIVSILSDRKYPLTDVVADHCKSEDKKRMAYWVYKYGVKKSRVLFGAENAFTEVVDKGESAKNFVARGDGWRKFIERVQGQENSKPLVTLKNLTLILENIDDINTPILQFDEFRRVKVYARDTPWGSKIGDYFTDVDAVKIKLWFSRVYRIEPTTTMIYDAIAMLSDVHKFHPIRDYLNTLTWDGVPRVGALLKDYFGAIAPEPYLSEVSTIFINALVKRVMVPGCKFDHVIILQGDQGVYKSTALRMLAGEEWFSDSYLNIGSKDTLLTIHSAWLHEMGELAGMRKADANALKHFVTVQEDRFRPPYGREELNLKRQCVFVGTTNDDTYLNDATGNRRFWPVQVTKCKPHLVKENRDQIFAEAMHHYNEGEKLRLYLTDGAEAQAKKMQADRQLDDALADQIDDFLVAERTLNASEREINPDRFSIAELFTKNAMSRSPLAGERLDKGMQMRVSDALKLLGYSRKRTNGRSLWLKKSIKN